MELLSTVARPEIRRDARRNRDRILDIARARVAAGDYSLPLNLIAREAGVGVGTVYATFPPVSPCKSGGVRCLRRGQRHRGSGEPDAQRALRLLIGRTLECMERRPELTAVLESPDIACLETLEMMSGFSAAVTEVHRPRPASGTVRRGITANDLRRLALPGDQPCSPFTGENPAAATSPARPVARIKHPGRASVAHLVDALCGVAVNRDRRPRDVDAHPCDIQRSGKVDFEGQTQLRKQVERNVDRSPGVLLDSA